MEEGFVEGELDGPALGLLLRAPLGKDVVGEVEGAAVTSTPTQTSSLSQQMSQHLQTTSASSPPSEDARQSDASSWMDDKVEQKTLGMAPSSKF